MRKLPKDMAQVILTTAEKNFDNNKHKFNNMEDKQLYMMAYLQGFEAAWSIYTDDDEEVLKKYDDK